MSDVIVNKYILDNGRTSIKSWSISLQSQTYNASWKARSGFLAAATRSHILQEKRLYFHTHKNFNSCTALQIFWNIVVVTGLLRLFFRARSPVYYNQGILRTECKYYHMRCAEPFFAGWGLEGRDKWMQFLLKVEVPPPGKSASCHRELWSTCIRHIAFRCG